MVSFDSILYTFFYFKKHPFSLHTTYHPHSYSYIQAPFFYAPHFYRMYSPNSITKSEASSFMTKAANVSTLL